MPTMAMSAAIMSTATMIPTMSIVARIPMPIIAMAVVAGTEAEINRRFDYHSRLVITIIDRRGITGRGDLGINRRWLADDYPRQGRQREREPNADVESHSGLRSRNGSEEKGC